MVAMSFSIYLLPDLENKNMNSFSTKLIPKFTCQIFNKSVEEDPRYGKYTPLLTEVTFIMKKNITNTQEHEEPENDFFAHCLNGDA